MSNRRLRHSANEVIDLLSSLSESEDDSNISDEPKIPTNSKKALSRQNEESDIEDLSNLSDEAPQIKSRLKSKTKSENKLSKNKSLKNKTHETDNDSDSLIEIEGYSSNEEEEEDDDDDDDDDDFKVQVPNSSPQRKTSTRYSSQLDSSPPSKITTKLPSLRAKFAFNEKTFKQESSDFKTDYLELKKVFPNLPASTIISALKSQKTLRNSIRYLRTISGESKSNRNSQKLKRLDSLSGKTEKLQLLSSPERPVRLTEAMKSRNAKLERQERLKEKAKVLEETKRKRKEEERRKILARKKAEEENIISSKVILEKDKKSIKDRFLSKYSKAKVSSDEDEDEDEDENEDEDDGIEIISDGSDDSIEELITPPTRSSTKSLKRKYDDDDDYFPDLKKRNRKSKKGRTNRAEKRAAIAEDEDFKLPEFEIDKDSKLNKNERILKLFNNADVRDIIDLATMKPEQASIIIKNRPYKNISEIRKLDLSMGKNVPKNRKTPIDRYIDAITEKLSAYEAIDTLLKQCFEYSKSITGEIRKWGVNLKGKNMNGELSITNIEGQDEDESEFDGKGSDDNDDNEDSDDSDEPIVQKSVSKKKFKIDGSENDDDYNFGGKKKIYTSNINNSKIKDKIGFFKKKPRLLSKDITLKDYQQVGINWINMLFQKQLSCILADEMGLGKTAQVIAFLSHLKEKKYKGPHLIVVPSSTLENWLREFEKFSPTLKVIPYYGSLDEREDIRYVLMEEDFDVVVTTYNLTTGKIDAPFLQTMNFNVIVYDEGHMLKNATSDRYKKLTKLKANFRLLLTGTPLQNNLKELISLLDFILPQIFDSKLSKLELLFDQKASTKVENEKIEGEAYNPLMSEQAISKAKVMMSPFVLRRTKAQVMKDLPPKHTKIEYCELTSSQKKIYDNEVKQINELRAEREKRKNLSEKELKSLPPLLKKHSNILMTLRKACMHPLLFRRNYTDAMLKIMARLIMENPAYVDANYQYIYEDMQVMTDFELTQLCHQYPAELGKFVLKQSIYEDSGKVKVLVEMLKKIIERGEKVLIFSLFTQLLDILEKVLSLHNWKFLRLDGGTAVDTRQTMIDKFYEDKTIPVFLLSTKAGGFGINLVCATNVIIFDQSLNPHDDKQAEDRAHRVGQTKDVHVTRLITKNSIEENILHLAFNKLQLDNSMMAQNVEDILLKTVEDVLASKDEGEKNQNKNPEDEEKESSSTNAIKESAFEAFETPLSLEMVAGVEKLTPIDEPVEVKESGLEVHDGKRTRRNRNRVNYYDGGTIALDADLMVTDDEDSKANKKDEDFKIDDSIDKEKEENKERLPNKEKTNLEDIEGYRIIKLNGNTQNENNSTANLNISESKSNFTNSSPTIQNGVIQNVPQHINTSPDSSNPSNAISNQNHFIVPILKSSYPTLKSSIAVEQKVQNNCVNDNANLGVSQKQIDKINFNITSNNSNLQNINNNKSMALTTIVNKFTNWNSHYFNSGMKNEGSSNTIVPTIPIPHIAVDNGVKVEMVNNPSQVDTIKTETTANDIKGVDINNTNKVNDINLEEENAKT